MTSRMTQQSSPPGPESPVATPEGANIAHVSPYATPASGITQVIAELSRQLAAQGFRMTVWSPGSGFPDGPFHSVHIQLRGSIARNAELALRTFAGLMRDRFGIEVVHCHQVHPQTIAALFAARILGKGAVLTWHVRPPEDGPMARLVGTVSGKLATSLASRRVTVSDRIRVGLPGHSWTIIPNGVSESDATSTRAISERPSGDLETAPDLVFAGRVTETKGIFTLLRAIALARARLPNVRLVTFGPVDSPHDYSEAKRQLGIDHAVVDRGFSASWRRELRLGQVFVLPSWYEGLPLAMLEAMAEGLPAIGTPVGGVPDILIPHETGLVVPVGDARRLAEAIAWMGIHPNERRAMGERARALIRTSFRAPEMATRYAQVYREIEDRRANPQS